MVKGRPNNHYPPPWHCSSLSCLFFYLYFHINWTFATPPLVTRKVNLRLDRRHPSPKTWKRIIFSARQEHGCSRWRGKSPFSLLLHCHHHHNHSLSWEPKQPANSRHTRSGLISLFLCRSAQGRGSRPGEGPVLPLVSAEPARSCCFFGD